MGGIVAEVIHWAHYLTAEQRIAYAVYMATLDVMREEDRRLEAHAQQLRDAVDAGEETSVIP